MNNFEDFFRRPRPYTQKKRRVLKSIRKNFVIHSRGNRSISECLPASGELTADLIIYHNLQINVSKNAYDIIVILAVNYYAILFMQIYSGHYTVNRKHAFQQVSSLAEGVLLKKAKRNELMNKNLGDMIQNSRDLSRQAVDIFCRAGPDGCKKHLAASIRSILLAGNQCRNINRIQIENIIHALCSGKYLNGNFTGIYSGS